jgi:hypothetical protein
MARIILGCYMVRFPLGGYLSAVLQCLIGFKQLGHDVYFVEKSGWSNACYDPVKDVMSDDCTYGIRTVDAMLTRFGLQGRWCFVDACGIYHGLSRKRIESIFKSADLFIDLGAHGTWNPEAGETGLRVLFEGEPGDTQMKMEKQSQAGVVMPDYDYYYTVGQNIGTGSTTAPTAGKEWHSVFPPVVLDLFQPRPPVPDAPFTTVMSWQAHKPIEYQGTIYHQKDVEFLKFLDLPHRTRARLEIAVAGKNLPRQRLTDAGWRILDAHAVSISLDSFWAYIGNSRGEFSVCKNVFVATNSGWFSDRAAVYLASGRPVVMQETGFSAHLPCGVGLFAVRTVDEAAAAINEINSDYERHSSAAREIAAEFLDARQVLGRFLRQLGI